MLKIDLLADTERYDYEHDEMSLPEETDMPAVTDRERIEALEAAVLELAEVILHG